MHCYECGDDGHVMCGETGRSGSEVAIIAPSRKCDDDGMVCYRSSNGVIPTEGANGFAGPQYSRFILLVRRNAAIDRIILSGRGHPTWVEGSDPAHVSGRDVEMADIDNAAHHR